MRNRLALLALLVFSALPLTVSAQTPSTEYATLLASLKAGNPSVDYARLRLSYMDSPEYKAAKDTSAAETAMMDALNAKDFAKALNNADTVLAGEYVNLDAHFVAFIASRETGAAERAAYHYAIFRGLVDSIRNSGDGKSPATAWVVINVHEEYVMLRLLGFKPGEQSVMHQDGHNYDVMKVKKADDGSDATLYFNVDIPFKHYGV